MLFNPPRRLCVSAVNIYSKPMALRGFSGFSFSNCFRLSFVSSEITRGSDIFTSMNWSPRSFGFRKLGNPRSRRRNFCPDSVPGGMQLCLAFDGRHFYLCSKGRFGHGDRDRYVNIVTFPLEKFVLADVR